MVETGKVIEGIIPHPVEGEDLTNSLLLYHDTPLTLDDVKGGLSFREISAIGEEGRKYDLFLMSIARCVAGYPNDKELVLPLIILKGNEDFVYGLCTVHEENNETYRFHAVLDVKERTGYLTITGIGGYY